MKQTILNNLKKIAPYEVYFFIALCIINLFPILLHETFLTVDGPAHLYNARLLHEMKSNNSAYLFRFYQFNEGFIPNGLGHLILSKLMTVVSALTAEKFLLILYMLGLPLSFRYLLKQVNPLTGGKLAPYLLFPFSYSFLFYFGFYNFHLGMVLLFITLALWLKHEGGNHLDFKRIAFLILLSLLIYFSHLFVYLIFVGVIGFLSLIKLSRSKFTKNQFLDSLKWPVILLLPGCILSFTYVLNHELIPNGDANHNSLSEVWKMIQSVEPARGVKYGKEGIFTKWVFWMLLALLGNLLFQRIKNFKAHINTKSLQWGGICLSILVALFILPDNSTFISARIVTFFFLFLIVFISTQRINIWLKMLCFLSLNYVNIALLKIYFESATETNAISLNIIEASKQIEPYSTVLPIDESNFWLLSHGSNYLGINKPLVILENYEATVDYFPLVWNQANLPFLHLGDSSVTPLSHPENPKGEKSQIDYVFIISDIKNPNLKGKAERNFQTYLNQHYKLVFSNKAQYLSLYKKL